MLNVKVLGPGCANCQRLEAIVRKVAQTRQIAIELEKVVDYEEIMKYNILATPGLVVGDKVVSAGRIPTESEIVKWLQGAAKG
ncbi:MAG: thioredoxin family protein [Aggregatilineales bacterium]